MNKIKTILLGGGILFLLSGIAFGVFNARKLDEVERVVYSYISGTCEISQDNVLYNNLNIYMQNRFVSPDYEVLLFEGVAGYNNYYAESLLVDTGMSDDFTDDSFLYYEPDFDSIDYESVKTPEVYYDEYFTEEPNNIELICKNDNYYILYSDINREVEEMTVIYDNMKLVLKTKDYDKYIYGCEDVNLNMVYLGRIEEDNLVEYYYIDKYRKMELLVRAEKTFMGIEYISIEESAL